MLHKEVIMNKVSPEAFISQWLPSHIKNKILFYLFKSPHSKGGQVITGTFHFGEKSYKVTSKQSIEQIQQKKIGKHRNFVCKFFSNNRTFIHKTSIK